MVRAPVPFVDRAAIMVWVVFPWLRTWRLNDIA